MDTNQPPACSGFGKSGGSTLARGAFPLAALLSPFPSAEALFIAVFLYPLYISGIWPSTPVGPWPGQALPARRERPGSSASACTPRSTCLRASKQLQVDRELSHPVQSAKFAFIVLWLFGGGSAWSWFFLLLKAGREECPVFC